MNADEITTGRRVTTLYSKGSKARSQAATVLGVRDCDYAHCRNECCVRVLWDGKTQSQQIDASELLPA